MSRLATVLAALALLGHALCGCTGAQPCPASLEVCNGTCVDLTSDPAHCGACRNACGTGKACLGGTCSITSSGACANRSGGAFVVLEACGETVKLWTVATAFITQAEVLRDAPGTQPKVPVLQLMSQADCDAQWTWHTDPVLARFDTAQPSVECDACPGDVGAIFAQTPVSPVWCPTQAQVIAVDRR
jgi:hypothetical protein